MCVACSLSTLVLWGYNLFSWIWLICCYTVLAHACCHIYILQAKKLGYRYYGGNVCKVNIPYRKYPAHMWWFLIIYWSFMVMCFPLLPIEYRISQVGKMPSIPYSIHPTVFYSILSLNVFVSVLCNDHFNYENIILVFVTIRILLLSPKSLNSRISSKDYKRISYKLYL